MTGDPHALAGREDRAINTLSAEALRAKADARWVEISHRVLTRALTVSRRSMPVVASSPGGPVTISEQVLVTHLHEALRDLDGGRPVRIHVDTDEDHSFSGVLVALCVDYPRQILPLSDEVRVRSQAVLRELLGPVDPPITVTTVHVHVEDVRPTP